MPQPLWMVCCEQSHFARDHAQSTPHILGSIKPSPRIPDRRVFPYGRYWIIRDLYAPSDKSISLIALTVLGSERFENPGCWAVRRPFRQQLLASGTVQDALPHKVADDSAFLHVVQDRLYLAIGRPFGPETKLLNILPVKRLLRTSECRVVSGAIPNLVAEWVR